MTDYIEQGNLKRIHVNQHNIRFNSDNWPEDRKPVLTVKTHRDGKRENLRGFSVTIHGPSHVIYSPDKPLSCGARVWIETRSAVTLIGETEAE